jgi:hypothetical protein
MDESMLVTVRRGQDRDALAARLTARGGRVQAVFEGGLLVLLDREAAADVRSWPGVVCVGGVHLPTRVVPRIRVHVGDERAS